MTCTGMYQGGTGSNDEMNPADKVVNDVGDAFTYIIGRETLPEVDLGGESSNEGGGSESSGGGEAATGSGSR